MKSQRKGLKKRLISSKIKQYEDGSDYINETDVYEAMDEYRKVANRDMHIRIKILFALTYAVLIFTGCFVGGATSLIIDATCLASAFAYQIVTNDD